MKAAVVSDFARPPAFAEFADPVAREGFVEVRPLAAAVHQLVRSTAAGLHYSSGDELPFVTGVDGIAELDGRRVYTGGCPDPLGTMAERTLVPEGWAVPVPDALETALAAAIVNPAMSSWLPLVDRGVPEGGTVAVLGATGASGSLAVRIALHLGAARVIAAGRNPAALEELAADPRVTTVSLTDDPVDAVRTAFAEGVDLVLDYVWGLVAEAALEALRGRSLHAFAGAVQYIQIGSLAGRTITLDAAILRARRISLSGSGGGSANPRLLFAELPKILDLAASGELATPIRTAPLADVTEAWTSDASGRLVLTI